MATSNNSFDVGLRNPKSKTKYSSDSDLSNYSDEEFKRMPKAPIPEKRSNKDLSKDFKRTKIREQVQSVPKNSTDKNLNLLRSNKDLSKDFKRTKIREQVQSVPKNSTDKDLNLLRSNKDLSKDFKRTKIREQVQSVPKNSTDKDLNLLRSNKDLSKDFKRTKTREQVQSVPKNSTDKDLNLLRSNKDLSKDFKRTKIREQVQSVPKNSTDKDLNLLRSNKDLSKDFKRTKTREQVQSVPKNSTDKNLNLLRSNGDPRTSEQMQTFVKNSIDNELSPWIPSKDKSRKSRQSLESKAPPRDSSVSSVSSQISQSSQSSQKTRKKRKKKKSSADDPQLIKELTYINFPLEEDYNFRLVCSRCLIKEKEGANGFTLNDACSSCAMDELAVKKKSGRHWVKIRKRMDCGIEFSGNYRLCMDFKYSCPCKFSPCTFAHGEGEQLIWMYEQEQKFKIDTFIQKLRKNNIVTDEMLSVAKSMNKYVPGLSSAKATSGPIVAQVPKAKAASKPNVSNSAQSPSRTSSTKISFIKEKNTVKWPLKSIPAKKSANFPEVHDTDYPSFRETVPTIDNLNFPELPAIKDTSWVSVSAKNKPNSSKFLARDITEPVTSKPEHSYSQLATMPKKVITALNPALKRIRVESWPFAKSQNPLKKTHDFRMFCFMCFAPNPKEVPSHVCAKNILAFTEKGTTHWLKVRERRKVRSFGRNYVLCDSLTGESSQCKYGPENCTYAHNTIEQVLWDADKQELFDLTKFILSHSLVKHKIFDFVQKFGTAFSFICGVCFRSSKVVVYENDKRANVCNSFVSHNWNVSKTLFYHPDETTINKNLSKQQNFYRRCFSQYCSRKNCLLAHSIVEREVWMLLRDTQITEETFIESLQACSNQSVTLDSVPVYLTPCPYKVEAMCHVCYLRGQKVKHAKCGHSKVSSGTVYFTNPGQKQICSLPAQIPKNYYFTICNSMRNNKCHYQGQCTFAHSEEEKEIWKWMCNNNIKKLDEIAVHQDKLSTTVVAGSSSIVQTSTKTVTELPVPHYCEFCNMSCGNNMEWENHCTTPEHNANVTSDAEQQWNYREPPWNYLKGRDLHLCEKHKNGQCLYSNMLDMYNLCRYAHGFQELEEWKKRFEWRQLRADMAKNPSIKSYIDKLQEKYLKASKPSLLMSEEIPNIQLKLEGQKQVTSLIKKLNYKWSFTITSTENHSLKKVALMHDKDRLYFKVSPPEGKKNLQVLDATRCQLSKNQWGVTVTYVGKMYGSFSQRIVFDFGNQPLLFQDLLVEVGTRWDLQRVQKIRKTTKFELWTSDNREIIPLPQNNDLLKKYKKPLSADNIVTQDVTATKLNRHNYVQKMHKLLYLEEFTCQQKISRYNLCADMTVSEFIQEESIFLQSPPGTLFGLLPLTEELSEDTDIGKMILTNCYSVYIASPAPDSKVYEAEFVQENNFNFKGCRRNKIFISLSQACIQDLELHSGAVKKVEIQFQIYRLSFCLMHFALDNLASIDIVFPDPVKNLLSQTSKPIECRSLFLNEEQLIAVKYILGQRAHFLCPFILNGAYGTGKTETLVQATMELLNTQPNCKILICTQCNSSADLFILKHLNEYMTKTKHPKILLRLYYSERRVFTVPEKVRKYTLLSNTGDKFRNPQKEDLKHVRIVITTLENCYQLIKLQLKGIFTHIFIDEAAQEFESKILLPLTLATEDTYVVLSGDHHQMGVKIHSAEARRQGLGKSIMQRLFEHYTNHPFEDMNSECSLHTLLVQNYRSVEEITRFISTCFYGIVVDLGNRSALQSVSGLKPLQLYVVFGIAEHDENSTSYYNVAEVNQVVDCINNISSNWPSELGAFNPKDICIVSAYRDQVVLIRKHLRREPGSLNQIVVEQIGNIPGKEFKVVIISTVRTSRCLDITPDKLANYSDENDEPDFFFNKKLLNTAMTRAKYSVITIGDPVALCAYGKCSTIWRIFLNHCSKMRSVKPSTITYNLVRHEVTKLLFFKEKSSTFQPDVGIRHSFQSASSAAIPIINPANSAVAKSVDIKGKSKPPRQAAIPIVNPANIAITKSVDIKGKLEPPRQAAIPIVNPANIAITKSVDIKGKLEPPRQAAIPIINPANIAITKSIDIKGRPEPLHPAAIPIINPATLDVEKRHSLQPEPSKPQTEFLKEASDCTLTKSVVKKEDRSGIGSSSPAVIPISNKASNCTLTKPVDIKGDKSGAEPLCPPGITSSTLTSTGILQLGLNEAVPLNHPKSKMDSLFSVSKTTTSSETTRINFSFPSVFTVESPTENFIIGLSVYKVEEHFIVGVHWPDVQGYASNENRDDASSSETVLALEPKQQLPNIPEFYFTSSHTIGATSCLMKVDSKGEILNCSFHQTLIKLQAIIQMKEIEDYLQQNQNKQELNFLNYLQKLTDRWCQIRLGNESLHLSDPMIDYPKIDRLLKEIFIQVHIQIVRFLSKVFPKTTPTAWLSFKEGPKLDLWKMEHISDALNSVLLLRPYLRDKICECKMFCKCLLDYIKQNELKSTIPRTLVVNMHTWQYIVNLVDSNKFEDAQNVILDPSYHSRIAVALKRLSDLAYPEFGCSDNDNSNYNLTFDPQIYLCKPSICFLDLLVQRMLTAAIRNEPNPVTVQEIQEVTKKLTQNIKIKKTLQKRAFFKKLKESVDQTIETQATIVSVTDSVIEIVFPQLVDWSYSIGLNMLSSRSIQSDTCSLEFTQIEVNPSTYSQTSPTQTMENRQKKIESNEFTICIEATQWQQILKCLRCKDLYSLKNCVQSTNSSAVLKNELYLPDYNINSEVHYCLEVSPYLNLQASVEIVEDLDGHCSPQVQLLHVTPNVSLCLLHRNKPLQCFLPSNPTALSEYQQRLLTEVFHLTIAQHRSVILRDVTLVQEHEFWTFTIPLMFLRDHNISLMPDIHPEEGYLCHPLQNMICIRFSLTLAKNVKTSRVFHGYICNTNCSESDVTVVAYITDDTHSHLPELKTRKCNLEILCWKPIHRCMADSILNIGAASTLAKNIGSRQLKPVKSSTVVFSVLEENEFAIIASENSNYSLSYLMHWFEDYASSLVITKRAMKSPILICTPNEHELDNIEDHLQMDDLFTKLNVVRVADICEEGQPSCTSRNKIFLQEKLYSDNPQLLEEVNAMTEIYGDAFKKDDFMSQDFSRILSEADVILCSCLTSRRSIIRSVRSIKQMIIFNAHLCSELLAMIPISYYNIERLGLFCSSELTPETKTSIVQRVLQSCPQTKILFQ